MAQDEQPDRRDEQPDVVYPDAIEQPKDAARSEPEPNQQGASQLDRTQFDPAQLDPAQLEEFRQFQQFQEFLKYSEAQGSGQPPPGSQDPGQPGVSTPPPFPPGGQPGSQTGQARDPRPRRPKRPVWRTLLGSKLFRRLVYILIAIIALNTAYQHYFGVDDSDDAAKTGGGKTRTNLVLPTTPRETVRLLYDHITKPAPVEACQLFTPQAAKSFASNMHTATCQIAINELNAKVTSKAMYAEPVFPSHLSQPPMGNTMRISSCELEVQNGERLGEFTLRKISKGQWIITGHQREPRPCPSHSGSSTDPTY